MPNRKIVNFANRSAVKVSKWKVETGQTVYHGRVLMLYEDEDSGNIAKLKSKCVGTVISLIAKEGEVLKPGDPVLEVEEGCSHPTVINDLCGECGADLLREGVSESNATVPMVHHIPQLKVSQQEAEMIGKADTERLLRERKLVLLVDLDQTLIHTTHDNIPNNIKDVHHFQLGTSAWYHTRLRPNTSHFLKEMNSFFELHICTFGVRPYAHMVANILDRDQSLFSNRILSRDECFNYNSKVANLQALFPNGDELVCIIDDRKDVWNNSPNLIPVKPYVFFTNTGDINDPNLPPLNKHSDFFAKGVKLKKRETPSSTAGTEESKEGSTGVEEFDVEDEDDYLLYLETILKKVHQLFYSVYDKEVEGQPHVRWVLEQLRGNVLKGCEIVFSGLVPLREGLENSEPYMMATDLGAKIGKKVSETTTHIVAAREGTAKLHESRKFPNIKIVNPQWLTTCLYRWEQVDERLFPLHKLKDIDKRAKDNAPLALTFDDVVSMQQEVQAEFNSDSSESDSNGVEGKSLSTQCVEKSCHKKEKLSLKTTVSGVLVNKQTVKTPKESFAKANITTSAAADTSRNPEVEAKTNEVANNENKEVDNVDKLIKIFKKTQIPPVELEFLKNKNPNSLKGFQIPKRVRLAENAEVRIIDDDVRDEEPSRKKQKTNKEHSYKNQKSKRHKMKTSVVTPVAETKNDHSVIEFRTKFSQMQEEHSLRMRLLNDELKNQTDKHNLLMQNVFEEHRRRMDLCQSEHSLRLHLMQKEHKLRLQYLGNEHLERMSVIKSKNQTLNLKSKCHNQKPNPEEDSSTLNLLDSAESVSSDNGSIDENGDGIKQMSV